VLACVTEVEAGLRSVRSLLALPPADPAAREAGALAARLRYMELDVTTMPGLHQFLDTLEADCNDVGETIAAEYFWGRSPLRRGA
jgi:uncharacterized alpha-E superfamily protein